MRAQLWIIAGPNGAGKSTLADRYIVGRIPLVNSDNIARQQPGLERLAVGRQAIIQQNLLLASHKSFAWETTMSGNRELKFMQRAQDAGYKVNLIFVSVQSPIDSILRVANRVEAGGHNVPVVDILRRFQRCLDNFPAALNIADRAFIFDNTENRRRLVMVRELGITRRLAINLPAWLKDTLSSSPMLVVGGTDQ